MNNTRKIDQKAISEAPKEETQKDPEPMPETITEEISVYYPEQLFAPRPYNSFRCGNLWYKTVIQPGETRDDAYDRAWTYLSQLVQKQFVEVRKDFWDRYNSMEI